MEKLSIQRFSYTNAREDPDPTILFLEDQGDLVVGVNLNYMPSDPLKKLLNVAFTQGMNTLTESPSDSLKGLMALGIRRYKKEYIKNLEEIPETEKAVWRLFATGEIGEGPSLLPED